jgi:hypothetical protein
MYLTRRAVPIRYNFQSIWGQCSYPPPPFMADNQQGLKEVFSRLTAKKNIHWPRQILRGIPGGYSTRPNR